MMNTREKGYSKRNKEVYWMNNPRNPNTETNQKECVDIMIFPYPKKKTILLRPNNPHHTTRNHIPNI